MKKIIKLYIFNGCALLSLLFANPTLAFENIYINKGIEENFLKFTSAEMVNDFERAITEYNSKRKNLKSMAGNIAPALYLAQFEKNTKTALELPEIIKGEGFYIIQAGSDKIQFDIDLILKNRFFLNGKLYTLDKFKTANSRSTSSSFNKMIDFLISSSIAGEDFIADSESTRLLIASIIALDGTFEKIGLTCVLTCKEKISKINNEKLVLRVKEYREACEKSSERQTESYNRYQKNKDFTELLLISNSDYEKTLKLLSTMSDTQKKGNDKKIVSKAFENTMNSKTCFNQIRNTYKVWATNGLLLSADAEALDLRARQTCDAISGLKACLSDFHSQTTAIYDSTKKVYKEELKQDRTKLPEINGISR